MGNDIVLSPIPLTDMRTMLADIVKEQLQQFLPSSHQQEQTAFDDKPLTRKQAADFFNISLPTLSTWVSEGRVKAHRTGGRVYFKRSDLDEALRTIKAAS
ncbi:MAG: DNA-binding protein [Sphingobacteriales bacterium]|nr:MAG: DNA-binding protein [Sphingobacteriales bacterium]